MYIQNEDSKQGIEVKLFICMPEENAEMAIHSISHWIRCTSRKTYKETNGADLEAVHKVSAHEVRAVTP